MDTTQLGTTSVAVWACLGCAVCIDSGQFQLRIFSGVPRKDAENGGSTIFCEFDRQHLVYAGAVWLTKSTAGGCRDTTGLGDYPLDDVGGVPVR